MGDRRRAEMEPPQYSEDGGVYRGTVGGSSHMRAPSVSARLALSGRSSGMAALGGGLRSCTVDNCTTPGSRYFSVDGSAPATGAMTPHGELSDDHDTIRRSYFYGQLADAMKRSIWWSLMGILVTHLTKSHYSIPVTRVCFNAALIFCSLFSDLVAETMPMRRLLCLTVLFRVVIWTVLVPLAYVVFGFYVNRDGMFLYGLIFLMLLDGFQEALSNTIDLIYKGIDRLSHHYDMVITEAMHSKMSNTYQVVFALSFSLLVIPLSLITYCIRHFTGASDLFVISGVMGGVFVFLSTLSLLIYHFGMRDAFPPDVFLYNERLELSVPFVVEEMLNKLDDIREGMCVALSQGYLMRHILFLAFETAFEHSVVSFIIPIIALTTRWLPENDLLLSHILCVLFISMGKFGGSIYGMYVTYVQPAEFGSATGIQRTSHSLQRCLVMSCMSLMLLPLALYMDDMFPSLPFPRIATMCVGILLFFAFSAYPKAVLSSSMNTAILSHPLSYKIFDFVGVFITLFDAFLVLALTFCMNKIEGKFTVEGAAFTATVFYVLHCLYQLSNGVGGGEAALDSSMMHPPGHAWTSMH